MTSTNQESSCEHENDFAIVGNVYMDQEHKEVVHQKCSTLVRQTKLSFFSIIY